MYPKMHPKKTRKRGTVRKAVMNFRRRFREALGMVWNCHSPSTRCRPEGAVDSGLGVGTGFSSLLTPHMCASSLCFLPQAFTRRADQIMRKKA